MKKSKTSKVLYTEPKISISGVDWFVWFRFEHAGKTKLIKLREGINYIKDKRERKREIEALREVRHDWLKAGWNPVLDPEFKSRTLITNADIQTLTFNSGMEFAFEKKRPDIAKKTIQDYRNILEFVKQYAIEIGLNNVPIKSVTRANILYLLQTISEARKWSNHRYNIYLKVICSMFSTLEQWAKIEYNPVFKMQPKSIADSKLYSTYTDQEKIKIADFLSVQHPQLLIFMQVIYHTGLRPKELILMKNESVDLKRRVIEIYPDRKAENTKTAFARILPISNALYPLLKAMRLEEYPADFYVFGSPFKPGSGNRGAQRQGTRTYKKGKGFIAGKMGSMRTDYLTPSPYHVSRDTVTKLWKELIKDQLGVNKCLYAGKHTGADDKILAGIDLDSLRNLYGHRSKYMTEHYATQVKEAYRSEIREKSPNFITAKVRKMAS